MATAASKGSKAAPLSRGDIVSEVAAKADLPQSKADQVVRAYEEAIIRALATGGEVRIAGFGTFRTSARAARTARNPQTGAPITIGARTVARFTPSSAFREAVGGGGSKGGAKGGGGSKGGAKGGSGGGSKGGASGGSKTAASSGSKGGAKGGAQSSSGGGSKGGSSGGAKGGAKSGAKGGSKK